MTHAEILRQYEVGQKLSENLETLSKIIQFDLRMSGGTKGFDFKGIKQKIKEKIDKAEKALKESLVDSVDTSSIKFHGTSGHREVCIQFLDTERNNAPDGVTFVVLNKQNRISVSNGLECTLSHGEKGTRIEDNFSFKVSKIEFTEERADAHPESRKFGKEQWQVVRVYGRNR